MKKPQQPAKKSSGLSNFFSCCMKPTKSQQPKPKGSDSVQVKKEENLNILSSNQPHSDSKQKQDKQNKGILQKLSEEKKNSKFVNEDEEISKSHERSIREVELIFSQRDQTKDGKMEPHFQEGLLIQVQNSVRNDQNSNSMVIYKQASVSQDKSVSSKSPERKIGKCASGNQNNSRKEQQLIFVNLNDVSNSRASPTFKAQTHNNSEQQNQSLFGRNQQQANIASQKQSFAYEQQNEDNISRLTKQQSSNKPHQQANLKELLSDEENENIDLAERPNQNQSNKILVSKLPMQLTDGVNPKIALTNSSGRHTPQASNPVQPDQTQSGGRIVQNPSIKDYVSYSYHSIKYQSQLDDYRSSQGPSQIQKLQFFRDSSEQHTDNLQLPEAHLKMMNQSHSITSSQTSSNKFKVIGDYGHISPITGQQHTESKILNSYSEDNDYQRQYSSNPNSLHSMNLGANPNYKNNNVYLNSQQQRRSAIEYNEIMHEIKKNSGASQVIHVNAVQIPEQYIDDKNLTFQNVNIYPPQKIVHQNSVHHSSTIATTPKKDQTAQPSTYNYIPKALFEAYHLEKEAQLNKAYKKIAQLSGQLHDMTKKQKNIEGEVKGLKKENLEIRSSMNLLLQLKLNQGE